MKTGIEGLDTLLVSPPLMHDAVAPAVALPALKAYLVERGHQASIRDLNAEFLYDHIARGAFIRGFLNALVHSERRHESLFVFREREWSDSCFTHKPMHACTVEEIEESIFRDERARAHYYRCVARLFDLEAADCHLDAFREIAERDNPVLEAFYRERLAPFFADGFPAVVGISLTETTQLYATFLLIALVKRRSPGTRVLIGGAWCLASSPLHRPLLEAFPDLDGIVNYEGEIPLARVIEQAKGEAVGDIPGLMFRDGDVIREPTRFETVPMDALPVPDFSEFPLHLYPGLLLPVQTYRGCSWGKCVFCIGQESAAPRQTRSAKRVVAVMREHVARTGCHSFFLGESSTPLDRMEAIADEILAQGLRIQWSVLTRADRRYTPEVCTKLYRAGLRFMYVGLETMSTEHLDQLKKGIEPDEFFHTARHCAAAGLRVVAFIMNFPMNTMQDMEATFQAVYDHRDILEDLIVQLFRLPLATEAFRRPEIMGIEVMPAESRNLDVFGLEYRAKSGFDNQRFEQVERMWTRRFHRARGSRPKSSPECWIDGALRGKRYRPGPPLPVVGIAGFRAAGETPETAGIGLPERCLEQYLLRDPELADRFAIRARTLDEAAVMAAPEAAFGGDGAPALAAFWCDPADAARQVAACRAVKQAFPETIVVVAGLDADGAGQVLRAEPPIDLAVVGEWERPLEQMVRGWLMGEAIDRASIPGLAWRDGEAVRLPQAPAWTPLETMPAVLTRDTLREIGDTAWIETSRAHPARSYPAVRTAHDVWAALSVPGVSALRFTEPGIDRDVGHFEGVLDALVARTRPGAGPVLALTMRGMDEATAERLATASLRQARIPLTGIPDASLQRGLATLASRCARDRLAFEVAVGRDGDAGDFEAVLRWCWDQGWFFVQPQRPLGEPVSDGTGSPEREPDGSVPGGYAVLVNAFSAPEIAFFRTHGIDFPDLASRILHGPDLSVPRIGPGGLSEAALRALPRPPIFCRFLAALEATGLPERLVAVARDVCAYREAEHGLLQLRWRDPAVIGPKDADPDEPVRIAGSARVALQNDIAALLRGNAPDLADIAPRPLAWSLFVQPGMRRVVPIAPQDTALFDWLLEGLAAPGGVTFTDLVKRLQDERPETDPRTLAGLFRGLAGAGVLIRAG